jgi:hypothetical protein
MRKYILLHSCAKKLAQKSKLRSRAKVFRKFGGALSTGGKLAMKIFLPQSGADRGRNDASSQTRRCNSIEFKVPSKLHQNT